MINLIEPYIRNISKDDITTFALKNNINLNSNELDFIYNFIKTKYKDILANPNNFNLVKYKQNFSNENFIKINAIFNRYKISFDWKNLKFLLCILQINYYIYQKRFRKLILNLFINIRYILLFHL